MILNDKEKLNRLRLIRSENVGPVTFNTLVKNFGSAKRAIEFVPELSKKGGKIVKVCSVDDAEKEIENTLKIGGKILFKGENDYPLNLADIYDAPPLISVLGKEDLLKNEGIAIVGTRHASLNASNFTRKISLDLSNNGYTVVSGLALGIDAFAHQSALEGKSSTIAVLGTGIDVIYPSENKKIYEQIRNEGLIVSEFPLSESPKKSNFPRRNRIISGLSKGVLVVEASIKSGSLITARFAIEQGKEVFAVPGFPFDPRCEGPNSLIKSGAVMVRDCNDIFDELNSLFKIEKIIRDDNVAEYEGFPSDFDEKEVDEIRENIIKLLSASEISVDDLIIECQKSAQMVLIALAELELAGRIERSVGNKVCLVF